MPKVLIADASARARSKFSERAASRPMSRPGSTRPNCAAASPVMTGWRCARRQRSRPSCSPRADALKVVGRAGIGVDNIDVPAASERGIVVMNTPYGNAITAAEHTIAMMFALARQIPAADRSTQAGKWEKSRFMGVELTGKTLGIIGCGNIGAIVADRAQGLKMQRRRLRPVPVARTRRRTRRRASRSTTAGPRRFHHAAHAADRRDPQHHRRRGDREDEARHAHHQLRARRLVVEEDLAAALDSGQVAGAAVDVFVEEPAEANPLFGREIWSPRRISARRQPRRRRMSRCRSPSRWPISC